MFRFRSLTAKFVFMGIIILAFIAVIIAATYVFTHHMEGEAKRINLAGKERMILVDIGRHSLQFADMPPSQERSDIIEDVKQKMKLYEEILLGLRDGSEKHGLSPIHSHAKEAIKQNNRLLEMWEKFQKSELERLMNMPDKGKAREYNLHLYVYVDEIDKLVTHIEKHSENEIRDFDTFRYYALGFFFLLISFIVLYIRQSIVKPVWRLKEATEEIEKGNFDIKVDVKSRDEIGALTEHFTQMARTLDINLAENTRLINNLTAVNKATNIIMSNLQIEEVLNKIVEEAQNLIGSKYCALGIMHSSGEEYEYFIPKGLPTEVLTEMKGKYGLPKGRGLLGHLLKEGKSIRLADISKHPASIGFPEGHPPMKTFLGVPVVLHDKVIGRLYFSDKHALINPTQPPLKLRGSADELEETGFTQEDEDLASSFANTAAIAINNASLLNTVTARKEELDALNVIAHAASQTLTVEVMLNNVLDAILNLGPLKLEKKGAIFLYEEKKALRLIVSKNFSDEHTELCSAVPFGECLCGIAAEKGDVLISNSNSEDKRHSRTYTGAKEHGHVILPLKSRDKMLGVLCLYLSAGIKLSDRGREMYESIADIISVSLQNVLSYKEIQIHSKELLALADASNVVLTTTTTTLYDAICDIAVRNFGLKMAWLGLIDEGRETRNEGRSYEVKPVAQAGFDEGYLSSAKITYDDSPTGMGPTGMAIKTKTAQVMSAMGKDPRYAPWREEALKRGYGSSMAAPLISSEGKIMGALNLYSSEIGFFTTDRVKIFNVFANQAATAIENRWLIEGLEERVEERTRQLEDSNQELNTVNKELEMRRQEAEEAKAQADAANRAKSDFLANMSHELRTPLNSIIGFSEILEDGIAGPIADNQKELANDISSSGKHLLSLINDILDLSKVEAGKMELESSEFNLKELIDGSLVMFKEKAMKHNIKIAAEVEEGIGNIEADERKIKQVLYNFLSNAFKFTPDGGSVRVSARLTKDESRETKDESRETKDEGRGTKDESRGTKDESRETKDESRETKDESRETRDVRRGMKDEKEEASVVLTSEASDRPSSIVISVADTGIGISPEDMEKLFQPFQQIDSALSRKYSGTGLGLNLCKKFVELHEGRIWVESEIGKGSRFVFVIPIKQTRGPLH